MNTSSPKSATPVDYDIEEIHEVQQSGGFLRALLCWENAVHSNDRSHAGKFALYIQHAVRSFPYPLYQATLR